MSQKKETNNYEEKFIKTKKNELELQNEKNIIISNEKKINCDNNFKELSYVDSIKKKIFSIRNKIKSLNLRHYAAVENLEKKTNKELKFIKDFSLEYFFMDFLSIIDSLEDMLKLVKKNKLLENSIIVGISLTRELLLKRIKLHGFKLIKTKKNDVFNKNLHDMELNVEGDKDSLNYVIEVVKKGYMFNNKILRKSTVKVHRLNK